MRRDGMGWDEMNDDMVQRLLSVIRVGGVKCDERREIKHIKEERPKK